MATVYEHRNLSMTPDHWQALEALAVQTNSRSTRGTHARQHSWRTYIERIAAGEIIMVEKNPYQMPEWLDEAADRIEAQQQLERQRLEEQRLEQERIEQQQRSLRDKLAAHAKQAQKTPLKMQQLNMLTELEPA